jgi:RNA polymerase sigma-70 factor, ECF subfamily
MTDELLVAALRRGDEDAFRTLIERYGRRVYAIARRYAPSHAEDVVQDVWVAALEGISKFEGRGSLEGWLFTIAANIARTRGVRESRVLPSAELPDLPAPHTEGPEARALLGARIAAARQALERLSPALRATFELRDLQGRSAAEATHLLGIGEITQRVRLSRARAAIRRDMAAALGEAA